MFVFIISGHETVLELLLTHGADVNARDSETLTPLHVSSENGEVLFKIK